MPNRQITIKKNVKKSLKKLPSGILDRLALLIEHLEQKGVNPGKLWSNFSKLRKNQYHCHLTYSYVACWEDKGGKIQVIEVYYVGSRENAPY